ncbi:unnamed protein product [Soboliphyme baturini]|uniref:LIM zinc-binding domain-containing protein n=1 Tax=Soboliphyme baturini TaxID=241478 RepID=A0A183IZU7_9BILA|nr:unnamed protein product [Soboliphyme baturini]
MADKGLKKCYVCCQWIPADVAVLAVRRYMCPQHLTCNRCNIVLPNDVWTIGPSPFCQECYQVLRQKITCVSCKATIEKKAFHELGGFWHKSCFVCQICRKGFPNNKYYPVMNKPYCSQHAKELMRESSKQQKPSNDFFV